MGNMAIKKSKSSVTIYFAPLDEVCVYVYVYVQKASSKFLADTRSAKHPPTKTQVDAGGTKEMLAKHTQAPRKRKGFAPLGSPRLSRKKKAWYTGRPCNLRSLLRSQKGRHPSLMCNANSSCLTADIRKNDVLDKATLNTHTLTPLSCVFFFALAALLSAAKKGPSSVAQRRTDRFAASLPLTHKPGQHVGYYCVPSGVLRQSGAQGGIRGGAVQPLLCAEC
ncbi:hypothetical protein J3E74DRAFT_38366 [Bipolaris maydis]|nr:hypothetical protein J3E74DRAFT_38366 [Bipolaris maydis]KAJ6287177.1 hypothetical protein J3E71DRAFT_3229 [Bipolaris maydis]